MRHAASRNYFIRLHRTFCGHVYRDGRTADALPLSYANSSRKLGRKSSSCSHSFWARVHCSLPFLPSGCLDVCLCTPTQPAQWERKAEMAKPLQ